MLMGLGDGSFPVHTAQKRNCTENSATSAHGSERTVHAEGNQITQANIYWKGVGMRVTYSGHTSALPPSSTRFDLGIRWKFTQSRTESTTTTRSRPASVPNEERIMTRRAARGCAVELAHSSAQSVLMFSRRGAAAVAADCV